MNSTQPSSTGFRFRRGYIVALVMLSMMLICALGIASFFRLSSDTQSLRRSFMNSVEGQWDKKFAIHIGRPTMALVRTGSRFFNMPKEPRAVLDALHGAEVGVYDLKQELVFRDYSEVFPKADKTMAARGWMRIVGVAKDSDFVAVYIPTKGLSAKRVACCVVVLHERKLVIASAMGNVEALLSAEWGLKNGEFRMRKAEWGMRSVGRF